MREIVVDSFAGGGGASLGISWALGHGPDIAINHDPEAVALHKANHPETRHYREDVWKVDPLAAVAGRRVGLMWLSPDCKHFSKAKGGKPVSPRVRGLAWVAIRWASAVRPRVIVLENVEEFQDWGPLAKNGKPDARRKGLSFRIFCGRLRSLGYVVEHRELRACDFGAPTSRKRLFLIARCDCQPIVWPEPTHGKGRPQPWRTAAECIDWSIPCPSIFLTQAEANALGLDVRRPLAEATHRRIAAGIQRYVIDAAEPFVIPVSHSGDARVHSIREPVRTITGSSGSTHAVVAPALINTRNGERVGQAPRIRSVQEPYFTVTAQGSQGALVAAFMAQHNTDVVGHAMREPVSTIVGKGCTQALVSAFLARYNGQSIGQDVREPISTIDCRDRFGLVTVNGTEYEIADIGMRMLTPRELYRAQGFPDSYRIDVLHKGKPLSKGAQIRMCGNSVCPPIAEALVRANYAERAITRRERQVA